VYYEFFVYLQESTKEFQERLMYVHGLRVCTRWCHVGGREHTGTRPKYGFCPRSRRHSGLRFVLFMKVDSRLISLIKGNR
jgi:hypothetical protein